MERTENFSGWVNTGGNGVTRLEVARLIKGRITEVKTEKDNWAIGRHCKVVLVENEPWIESFEVKENDMFEL